VWVVDEVNLLYKLPNQSFLIPSYRIVQYKRN
jgi:hypothetical protein